MATPTASWPISAIQDLGVIEGGGLFARRSRAQRQRVTHVPFAKVDLDLHWRGVAEDESSALDGDIEVEPFQGPANDVVPAEETDRSGVGLLEGVGQPARVAFSPSATSKRTIVSGV